MLEWLKKFFYVLLAAFLLYYLFTQPEESAQAVKTFFTGIGRLFRALAS